MADSAGVSILSVGDWEARCLIFPSTMISFQLVVVPFDSYTAPSPVVPVASITNSQYC